MPHRTTSSGNGVDPPEQAPDRRAVPGVFRGPDSVADAIEGPATGRVRAGSVPAFAVDAKAKPMGEGGEPAREPGARVLARLHADLALVIRSFEVARLRWLAVLLVGAGVCAGMGFVGDAIGGSPAYLYGEFREEGLYGGFMTAVSSFFLGATGTSLLMAAALLGREGHMRRFALAWAVAAVGLLVLGADDLLMIHEIVGYRLARAGVPALLGVSQDNFMFLAYAAVLVPFLGRLATSVRLFWRAAFPLAVATALFATAEVLDMVVPTVTSGTVELLLAPTDRMAKVLGTVMVFAFAQVFLFDVATGSGRRS